MKKSNKNKFFHGVKKLIFGMTVAGGICTMTFTSGSPVLTYAEEKEVPAPEQYNDTDTFHDDIDDNFIPEENPDQTESIDDDNDVLPDDMDDLSMDDEDDLSTDDEDDLSTDDEDDLSMDDEDDLYMDDEDDLSMDDEDDLSTDDEDDLYMDDEDDLYMDDEDDTFIPDPDDTEGDLYKNPYNIVKVIYKDRNGNELSEEDNYITCDIMDDSYHSMDPDIMLVYLSNIFNDGRSISFDLRVFKADDMTDVTDETEVEAIGFDPDMNPDDYSFRMPQFDVILEIRDSLPEDDEEQSTYDDDDLSSDADEDDLWEPDADEDDLWEPDADEDDIWDPDTDGDIVSPPPYGVVVSGDYESPFISNIMPEKIIGYYSTSVHDMPLKVLDNAEILIEKGNKEIKNDDSDEKNLDPFEVMKDPDKNDQPSDISNMTKIKKNTADKTVISTKRSVPATTVANTTKVYSPAPVSYSSTTASPVTGTAPATGDSDDTFIWVITASVAAFAAGVITVFRKRVHR